MRAITTYYADGIARPFYSRDEALRAEAELQKIATRALENSARAKLDLLKAELENCQYVPLDIIATCSFDSLAIKAIVKVCQKFAEENKQYQTTINHEYDRFYYNTRMGNAVKVDVLDASSQETTG